MTKINLQVLKCSIIKGNGFDGKNMTQKIPVIFGNSSFIHSYSLTVLFLYDSIDIIKIDKH